MTRTGPSLLLLAPVALLWLGCASDLERGERLYRQGDLPGALSAWHGIQEMDEDHEVARRRADAVGAELDQMLRRYEKRAQFFESEGRLGEAVLYYRLALKIDPDRPATLARVQSLVRELRQREHAEREALSSALQAGTLRKANQHAAKLARLNPFDPAIQIEVRQVRLAAGGEMVRHLEAGKRAYSAGDRESARQAFESVLALDKENQTALGYLSYIHRFDEMEERRRVLPPPRSISQEEILAEGHYRAAEAALAADDPFRALTEYRAALRVSPKHSEARAGLQKLRGELDPMVEELYATGKRYFQDEDLHNALRSWRRVLLIDPAHQRSQENVERAEKILSRLEEIQTGGS